MVSQLCRVRQKPEHNSVRPCRPPTELGSLSTKPGRPIYTKHNCLQLLMQSGRSANQRTRRCFLPWWHRFPDNQHCPTAPLHSLRISSACWSAKRGSGRRHFFSLCSPSCPRHRSPRPGGPWHMVMSLSTLVVLWPPHRMQASTGLPKNEASTKSCR